MGFLDLFVVASVPVLKVLLITSLGVFLALDGVDILGDSTRKLLNNVVFFVFNPALVYSNLANTVTFSSVISLWFMPINILITFIIGSILGWMLVKITKAPQHLRGLVIGSCAAGNLGNLPLIIIPSICKEKSSPFGDSDVCYTYGMSYASLSMAIGAIYLWSYVYNIVRVSSSKTTKEVCVDEPGALSKEVEENGADTLLPSKDCSINDEECVLQPLLCSKSTDKKMVMIPFKIKRIAKVLRKTNLKAMFAPSTSAAIVGFIVGLVPQMRKLLLGNTAPLHFVQDSASLLGDAAIPTVTLIIGGNLLKGLKGSGVKPSIVVGIIAVRYILMPLLGIGVVKGAVRFEMVHSDALYQFILLLQYALPPAMNIGTITQLFGAGETECSVILVWTYALASVSLTLWSTFFMWLVAA